MSATASSIRHHAYFDSILLMRVARALGEQQGVLSTAALMATSANKRTLLEAGFHGPEIEAAAPDDLVVGVTAATEEQAQAALAALDGLLRQPTSDERWPATIAEGVAQEPAANLAVISVPGEYAAGQMREALAEGLHVFCFSSNVALEDEVAIKREAASRGLLVMGPDCGTAIIAGRGIGFANVVRRGPVGIVGASGTGIQAISSLLHGWGSGVSQAIGTGSRDPSDEVGGISTQAALDALLGDPETKVIVLVSKPPGPRTLAALLEKTAEAPKPIVRCFLGEKVEGAATTLEEAAGQALRLAGHAAPPPAVELQPPERCRGRVIGLFAGGSLANEARTVLAGSGLAPDSFDLIDMGSEELTRGRPHPMIDPRPRLEAIARFAADSTVGVLLVDVVLGRGAAPDPAGDLAPAVRAAIDSRRGGLAVIASVIGTEDDPQVRSRQEATLAAAGAAVFPTSARAAAAAAEVIS